MPDLIYNQTGQSLTFDCPEGIPTSVTSVQVWAMTAGDDQTAESALDTPAIDSTPSTTFDAASGVSQADRNKCNLTATTGIQVATPYLLTNATGETEWVEIIEVSSGDYARTRYPLANDYAIGDTFETCRISVDVLDAWIQDLNNISDDLDPNPSWRVRWTYVVGGVTCVRYSTFDVVRYKGAHSVRPIDVDVICPGWMDALPPEHIDDRGSRLIDAAYSEVVLDLSESDIPDELIRNQANVNALVIRKAIAMAEESKTIQGASNDAALVLAKDNYQARLDKLFRITNKTAMAVDSSGAGARPLASPFFSK